MSSRTYDGAYGIDPNTGEVISGPYLYISLCLRPYPAFHDMTMFMKSWTPSMIMNSWKVVGPSVHLISPPGYLRSLRTPPSAPSPPSGRESGSCSMRLRGGSGWRPPRSSGRRGPSWWEQQV